MTTYDGLDLLDITPNVQTSRDWSVSRPVVLAESPQGNVLTQTTDAPPSGAFALEWHCITRAELAALETFLQARKGQSVACWIPTYQNDVEVINPAGGWDVTESVISAYPATEYPYRRWIRLGVRGLSYDTHYYDTAVDNGDGTWHWGTSPGSGPSPVGTLSGSAVRVCRLMMCRMTSDSYHVVYHTGDKTTVTAEFVEVAGDVAS